MANLWRWLRGTELCRSIFRHGPPDNPKDRALVMTSHLLFHIHPVKVKRHGLRCTYTFGLGGLSLACALILTFTGVLLMLYYVPSTEQAYADMVRLRNHVAFGWLFRNLHRWAAHAMVIFVFLHMCRVFYTASYKGRRKFNWVIGVFLLLVTLFLSFTGYLLPWDQLSYWAISVGTSLAGYVPAIGSRLRYMLLGSQSIGQNALLRFYVLHVVVLPSILAFLLAVHFFRVRKDGGISGPPGAEERVEEPVPLEGFVLHAGSGDGGQGPGGYPISGIPRQEPSSSPGEPPTYTLLGVVRDTPFAAEPVEEEMVLSFPDLILREAVAFMALVGGLLFASVLFDAPLEEMANPSITPNPAKAPWYFLGLQELLHFFHPFIAGILVPGGAVLALLLLPYLDKNPNTHPGKRRSAITIFTAAVLTVIILTVIGTFFRGPGWRWVWPWQR